MSIKILRPAVLTTLVSDGRVGSRSLGIGPGGPMDFFAMKIANYLVGNDREAVLEIGHSSIELSIQKDSIVAITGKGFNAEVNDNPVLLWKPIKIKGDSTLKLKKISGGAWVYLSVHGGWASQSWLNSLTTNLSAKAGGYHGRILQKDDVVEMNNTKLSFDETKILSWGISTNELDKIYSQPGVIRCLRSVETELLSSESREKFESLEFAINSQSNRMGYRLQGEPISLAEKLEMVSSSVDFGTVQLLPDGNLIVLMADHQTTGGYPRIASVIKADLPKLAQLMPGEKVKFKMISLSEAETELLSREQSLNDLKESCHDRFEKYFQK